MSRKVNDGDESGYKQDRFRNSRFEQESHAESESSQGMSRKTINTLGGVFDENRGRRSADMPRRNKWESSPFENGGLSNWKHRQGWDEYYDHSFERGNRRHGGSLIGHDAGHRGRGPKGYRRPDQSVYEDVCDMLSRSPDVDAREIEVSVKEGIVYLNGTVPDRDTKKMAELTIENISGVIDVQNLLNFIQSKRDLH